ncbi:winged helix-turn-helix domain-containing protein [Dactylosporangium sp. CA-052675]|uniref:winged helix-turn-helix domain-containing protein n=1 Tax=Dactylosporangium sp. CA-052675 TaxID=3239927 RepID=UPI003D8FDC69
MLDRRSVHALYRQVANALQERVRSGDLPPGSVLPSEAALAEQYEVSRDVVRDAMTALRSEGVIVTERGRRSRVRRTGPLQELPVPPAAEITARMPTADERHDLQIVPGVPLIVIRTDEFETRHPADRVVLVSPPERGGA